MTALPPHMLPVSSRAAERAADLRAALPVLHTPRCVLRAPVLEDAVYWNAILVPDAAGHLGGPHDEAGAFTEFAATVGTWLLRGHGLWTVTNHAGTVLGFVLVGFEPGDQAPELGWLFLPEARGKGYATEAAMAARAHALGPFGLPELVSYIAPDNAASRRLAMRLGARRDGEIRDTNGGAGIAAPLAEVWRHAPQPMETA